MKVEQLLVQYLYKNKTVSIENIGRFTIAPETTIPAEGDKDTSLPEGAIQFEFDKKAMPDEGLIDFIVEQSRKIRPLATSDLESYTILTRQFLNIGKPLHIEGMGILQKNQQGSYEFIQGTNITSRTEVQQTIVKEKMQEEISFSTPPKKIPATKGWMIAVVLFLLVSGAVSLYYYFNRQKDVPITGQTEINSDSSNQPNSIAPSTTDSLLKKDTTILTAQKPSNDGYTFKIVIKEYSTKAAAEKAFTKLTSYGHTLLLTTKDSASYKIAMPFTNPVSDTVRAKDSLRKFFSGKPYVEL